ncbi:MAG: hypothetical protein EZS28_020427 [Streblomastix strix]|uniref:Uncharacterized protein n=1 Tax=Streblomastix strix TaxID=222440 RepID=A0A5J4VNW7_9EUKA|nr:MAG: hypothetical protein EZS28_020427 [Streblomastix strix]
MSKYFISGVIQANLQDGIVSQDYRRVLKEIIETTHKGSIVIDPHDICEKPQDIPVDDIVEIRRIFEGNIQRLLQSDIIVAYLPTCSNGTSIEIYEAFRAGKTVYTITSLKKNWVVKLYSTKVFDSINDFSEFLKQTYKQ